MFLYHHWTTVLWDRWIALGFPDRMGFCCWLPKFAWFPWLFFAWLTASCAVDRFLHSLAVEWLFILHIAHFLSLKLSSRLYLLLFVAVFFSIIGRLIIIAWLLSSACIVCGQVIITSSLMTMLLVTPIILLCIVISIELTRLPFFMHGL